jgi:RNA polymerase sigma-70 factor (ECF subfamily)
MPSNATALSRLLLAERPSLLRLAQRIVGSAPAAEDVAQSLWFKVQRIEDHPPITNKRAFLFRLASNLATDHVRSECSRANIEAKAQAYLRAEPESPSSEQAVIIRDELARVLRAAEALPEPTKGIFRLHRFQGLTQAEVAAHYGVSTTTIEKHMRRAMATLRKARDAE